MRIEPMTAEDRVKVVEHDDWTEVLVDGEFFDDSRPVRTCGTPSNPRASRDSINSSRIIMRETRDDLIKIINATVETCIDKIIRWRSDNMIPKSKHEAVKALQELLTNN